MSDEKTNEINVEEAKRLAKGTKQVMREPILRILLERSLITEAQLETLLIDLVVEDAIRQQIPYEEKASLRSKKSSRTKGVSRGAFNRTLKQARRNVTRCLYTMLLLAYLGLFDFAVFRPFEEVAAKIGNYRKIRDVLSGRSNLTDEELESYHASERAITEALENMATSLILKSEISRRRGTTENEE